jgi:hypothetical protein
MSQSNVENLRAILESYKDIFGVRKYSEKEIKYIINRITNSVRQVNDSCMDNFRFSDDSIKQNVEYEVSRSQGC